MFDAYARQIEEMKDLNGLGALVCDAQDTFASMVHEIRTAAKEKSTEEGSPIIDRCKNYVFSHLHGRITVENVAQALRMHPNYLTTLFRESEGITLYQFILKEKISLAKNLLIYSDYHYAEIAEYLGFSSQSHLARQFRSETGMTLKAYRDRYGMRDETFSPEISGETGDITEAAHQKNSQGRAKK